MINFRLILRVNFQKLVFLLLLFSVIIRGLFAFVIALWVQNFIVKIYIIEFNKYFMWINLILMHVTMVMVVLLD